MAFFLLGGWQAAGTEPWGWFRFDRIQDGEVASRRNSGRSLWLEGSYQKNQDGTVSLNGKNSGAKIYNSGSLGFDRGLTLNVVFRMRDIPGDTDSGRKHDAWFYKSRSFVFSRRGKAFYVNFHNGEKWLDGVRSGDVFQPGDNTFHHAAVVIAPHHKPEQGEKWTDVSIYLDGAAVASRRFSEFLPVPGDDLWEIGCASTFGEVWRFGGELAEVKIFDRALEVAQIRKEVLAAEQVKPAFRTPAELTETLRRRVEALAQKDPASASALRMAAEAGIPADSARILPLPAGDTTLTLVETGEKTVVASWFDHIAQRELLNWDNRFYSLRFGQKEFTPTKTELIRRPEKKDGVWRFLLRASDGVQNVESDFEFDGRKLTYALKYTGKAVSAVFPAVRLARMTRGEDVLLVPNMSGVELRSASTRGASYSQPYPSAYGAMQFGAVYDDAGGILFSAGDPLAAKKQMTFSAAHDGTTVEFEWSGTDGRLLPETRAHLELFRGNWFDAAGCYRRLLTEIKAPWFNVPPKSPQWFRDHNLWLTADCSNNCSVWLTDIAIRKYLELGFILHGYHYGAKFDRDYPYLSPSPHLVERRNFLRPYDIRLVPYGNGRLWEKLDRRDEDFTYTKLGLPNSVKDRSGKTAVEYYNGAAFSVICPETPVFQSMMRDLAIRMAALGLDGIYFDQVGAGRPVLCYDPKHVHTAGDGTSWFRGQNRTFRAIHDSYREKYPAAVLVTEDNAETCAGNFDGGLAWRWMNEGQVPLYPAVYAGRIQMFGLHYFGKADYPAARHKAAWQFVSGMQLGWFGEGYFIRPERTQFRRWIKKLIHLRSGLKPFLADGEFDSPIRTGSPLKRQKLYWGPHGDKYITSPELYAGHWRSGNEHVIALLNPTDEKIHNTLQLQKECSGWKYDEGKVNPYRVSGREIPFELSPGSVSVLLFSDRKEHQERIASAFEVIRRVPAEADPFSVKHDYRERKKVQWLPPESNDFIADEPDSGLLRINTGKFSCVFFPGRLYPVWFQHAGIPLSAWQGEGITALNDPVYRAEFDLRGERRILSRSSREVIVETSGYLCSKDDTEPVPRRPVTLRYRFRKDSNQLEISGRVSEGNDFVKKIICIPREQAPAPPCSKKDKSTDRINRLRGG